MPFGEINGFANVQVSVCTHSAVFLLLGEVDLLVDNTDDDESVEKQHQVIEEASLQLHAVGILTIDD